MLLILDRKYDALESITCIIQLEIIAPKLEIHALVYFGGGLIDAC